MEPIPPSFSISDIICQLIKTELNLTDEQVWIYNQKRNIPETGGLFVKVGIVSSKPFGVTNETDTNDDGDLVERQYVSTQETYNVSLYSRDESAITRANEVIAALSCNLSQQLQELHGFSIAKLPTVFVDASFLEASSRLFRQEITFNALRVYIKEKIIEYYDTFTSPELLINN